MCPCMLEYVPRYIRLYSGMYEGARERQQLSVVRMNMLGARVGLSYLEFDVGDFFAESLHPRCLGMKLYYAHMGQMICMIYSHLI